VGNTISNAVKSTGETIRLCAILLTIGISGTPLTILITALIHGWLS
jgi:hypothetical protein